MHPPRLLTGFSQSLAQNPHPPATNAPRHDRIHRLDRCQSETCLLHSILKLAQEEERKHARGGTEFRRRNRRGHLIVALLLLLGGLLGSLAGRCACWSLLCLSKIVSCISASRACLTKLTTQRHMRRQPYELASSHNSRPATPWKLHEDRRSLPRF